MNEENQKWPEDVLERLDGYAEKHGIKIGEAVNQFTKWLKNEYPIEDPLSEDPFYLSQWSEQFLIENRNLSGSGGGSLRDTTQYVGMFVGIEDEERDNRKTMFDRAVNMFRKNQDRAINEKHIGILTAKEGKWHINGVETEERVDGSNLPWFGFEQDDVILCLLKDGKPLAPTSVSRTAYFLGTPESGGDITMWRINLQGNSMNADYKKWVACRIEVVEPSTIRDTLYTNRNFHETVEYTDAWLPEHLRKAFSAERLLINPKMHDYYVDLADLVDEHSERKSMTESGVTLNPIVITKGYVGLLNKQHMDSEYDQTGRSYRMTIFNNNTKDVTVWIPGKMHDDDNVFQYQNDAGKWLDYAERTQVIVVGRLRLKPYNNEMQASLGALGIFIPPMTARPAGGRGDTSLGQFGGDEQ